MPSNESSSLHHRLTCKLGGLSQVGDERSRRVEAIWAQVGTVLKQLLKQRDASVFAQPVDAVKLQVPTFPSIICPSSICFRARRNAHNMSHISICM